MYLVVLGASYRITVMKPGTEFDSDGGDAMLGTVINLVLQIFSGALGGHLAEAARSNNQS
jgi:hypothetical protein